MSAPFTRKDPAIVFGMACLTFSMRGLAATEEERRSLGRACDAAPLFPDGRMSLLKVAARACVAAAPLTDEQIGALNAALDGLRASEPGGDGKPRYYWNEGQLA